MRRKRLFLFLCGAGLAVALGLAGYYALRRWHDPSYPIGARAVIVLLVLLNARQNLRQYRYAAILERLAPRAEAVDGPASGGAPADDPPRGSC